MTRSVACTPSTVRTVVACFVTCSVLGNVVGETRTEGGYAEGEGFVTASIVKVCNKFC